MMHLLSGDCLCMPRAILQTCLDNFGNSAGTAGRFLPETAQHERCVRIRKEMLDSLLFALRVPASHASESPVGQSKMDGWMAGWMDGWMDGWVGGWVGTKGSCWTTQFLCWRSFVGKGRSAVRMFSTDTQCKGFGDVFCKFAGVLHGSLDVGAISGFADGSHEIKLVGGFLQSCQGTLAEQLKSRL